MVLLQFSVPVGVGWPEWPRHRSPCLRDPRHLAPMLDLWGRETPLAWVILCRLKWPSIRITVITPLGLFMILRARELLEILIICVWKTRVSLTILE